MYYFCQKKICEPLDYSLTKHLIKIFLNLLDH